MTTSVTWLLPLAVKRYLFRQGRRWGGLLVEAEALYEKSLGIAAPPLESIEEETRREAEEYYRQRLAEKKAASLDSSQSAAEGDGRSETA